MVVARIKDARYTLLYQENGVKKYNAMVDRKNDIEAISTNF